METKKYKWQQQEAYNLTMEDVVNAKPHSIIFEGLGYIEHPWFNHAKKVIDGGNLEDDGRSVMVRFVLYRGGIADWCIYHSLSSNISRADYLGSTDHLHASYDLIARSGAKPHDEAQIRALIDCTDEVFNLYRH